MSLETVRPAALDSLYASYEYAAFIVGAGCSKEIETRQGIAWTRDAHPLFEKAPVYTTEFQNGVLILRNTLSGKTATVADIVEGGNSLLAVLSGDGILAKVGQDTAIAEKEFSTLQENRSALITEGFGNGSILQIILNGAKGVQRPPQLIDPTLAELQNVPLIEIDINGVPNYAVLGFGVGALGEGAFKINDIGHRNSFGYKHDFVRIILHEGRVGLGLMEKVSDGKVWVDITMNDDTGYASDERRRLISLDYANGPLLAKYMAFPNFRLDDRSLRRIILDNTTELTSWIWGVQTSAWQTQVLPEGKEDTFTLHTDTHAHIDGNFLLIKNGSEVTVRVSKLGFMAVANRTAQIEVPRLPVAAAITSALSVLPTRNGLRNILNPRRR